MGCLRGWSVSEDRTDRQRLPRAGPARRCPRRRRPLPPSARPLPLLARTMDASAQSSRADAAQRPSASGCGTSAPRQPDRTAQSPASSPSQSPSASMSALAHVHDDPKQASKASFVADPVVDAPAYGPPVRHGCEQPPRRVAAPADRPPVFASALAPMRRQYFIIVCRATLFITILMWISLPVYVPLSPRLRTRPHPRARADTGARSPTPPASPATSRPGSSTSTATASAQA